MNMKKIIILLFISIFLSSCFSTTSDSDIEKAKQSALNWDSSLNSSIENTINQETTQTSTLEENISQPASNWIEVKYLTEEKFLEIDNFLISDFLDLEQEVTWKTLTNVDKISVSYANLKTLATENFTLQKFKAWDQTFMFRAFKKYNTLDYWENIFVISAFSWEKISKLEYKVIVPENIVLEEKISFNWEEVSLLPTSAIYWNPVELWNWKITYTDVKWLEIEKISKNSITNEENSVTDFLKNKYKNIFYWNTKRTISGDEGISFFVVRVEWNKYFYEKHYFIGGYYGVLSLEEWDFNEQWTLEEKTKVLASLNVTLKEKNDTYQMVKIANILFQNLKK